MTLNQLRGPRVRKVQVRRHRGSRSRKNQARNNTLDIVQRVDADTLDPIYLDSPYYMAPDGPVAEEAFRVIREAFA